MIELHRQLARNVGASWARYAIRLVISFFFVPYITTVLGNARFGVWVIVFQTINYFSLLDFGLEKALVRFISSHLSKENFDRINRILHTAFGLYLIVGSAIILGSWLTATYLFDFLRIGDPALLEEGRLALIIIGVYMGARFYLMPFGGSLGGFQRFDISNGLEVAEEIARAIVLVALLNAGYGLPALATAILGLSLIKQLGTIIILRRLFPRIRLGLRMFERTTAGELFAYSRITFGITLAWLVIFNTDVVLLGLLSSSGAAGVYAPGAQLLLMVRNAVNAVATPLTSAISQLESEGNMDAVRRLYFKGLRYTSYLSFFMAVGVILYARPFVALWLQPEYAGAAPVMQILAVSGAFFIPQIVGNSVLFGISRHHHLLRVLVLEAALKLVLSLILIGPYGLQGMAIAAAVPQFLLYVSLYPILIARELEVSPVIILLASIRSGFAAMFVALPMAVALRVWLPPETWLMFSLNIVLVGLPALAVGYFVLDPADRNRVRGWLPLSR
ncbi:MAG: oligosaccharide flippase family protein [candidate division Zixibacteria bacterium]|nr:oligosaccharide flippase family protein [candidate division Zixibacteria bacterium]